jgi:pimeloyl-CoA synthetase
VTDKDRRLFEAIGERDYLRFCIEQMHEEVVRRSPLDAMIDQATGREAEQIEEAKTMMKRIERLTEIIEQAREAVPDGT